MSREVYQVFPAPTLQLIRRHLSLSGAPLPLLSLRLRFSFSLMRFWNLSQAVCCLSACHRSFAHRQIWGVCVFCEAADYSRPRDWCSLFNMFTCKTRFVGAAAAAAVVCCCPPPPLKFSCDCWIKYWKLGLFQPSKYRDEEHLNPDKSSSWSSCFWSCQSSGLEGFLRACYWFKVKSRVI